MNKHAVIPYKLSRLHEWLAKRPLISKEKLADLSAIPKEKLINKDMLNDDEIEILEKLLIDYGYFEFE